MADESEEGWVASVRGFCAERGIDMSDEQVAQVVRDSRSRGKQLHQLLDRLAKKFPPPATEKPAALPQSKPLSFHNGQIDRSRGQARPTTPPPMSAEKASQLPRLESQPLPSRDLSGSREAERRAHWRGVIVELAEQEGLGQTESDVEDLLEDAQGRGISYEEVYRRMETKFRGRKNPAPSAAAVEGSAAPRTPHARPPSQASPSPRPAQAYRPEDDPYFHRVARLLHYHRAAPTRVAAEASATTRLQAAARAESSRESEHLAGEMVYERLLGLYGHPPPPSWVPPPENEQPENPLPPEVHKAEAEALAAAAGAARAGHGRLSARSRADSHGADEGSQPRRGATSQRRSRSLGGGSSASVAAEVAFPDDDEAQRYFVRVKRYSRHHKLGQRGSDISQLITEQRKRGKPLERIMEKLVARFGSEPEPSDEMRALEKAADRKAFARRVRRILEYYQLSPTDDDVRELLDACDAKGRPYTYVVSKLTSKYGPEPADEWVVRGGLGASVDRRGGGGLTAGDNATSLSARSNARGDLDGFVPPDRGRGSATQPPVTQRALAFNRLKRYALHLGWKRSDSDLHQLLDDAELRRGGYDGMFVRLERTFGPEPRGPGALALDDPTADPAEERRMWKDRVEAYCAHYGLKKTAADIDAVLDKYSDTGWDVLLDQLEARHGPAPFKRSQREDRRSAALQGADKMAAHWNLGGDAPSPSYREAELNAQRAAVLRKVSDHFRLNWSDDHIRSLLRRGNFDTVLTATERRHGPIPEEYLHAVPREHVARSRSPAGSTGPLLGDSDRFRGRPTSRAGGTGAHTAGDDSAVGPYDSNPLQRLRRQPSVPRSGPYARDDKARFEAEYAFWLDRVLHLFELHNPSYAHIDDVDDLLRMYVERGISFERMWGELTAKYGPEGASVKRDTTRRYWREKFKRYCDHYRMPKTDTELDAMIDDFEPKGWARMYDRLVELHGPPPPMPPSDLNTGEGMNEEQWRERLRDYCRAKFPAADADRMEHYLSQFKDTKGLENIYATLTLLHGLAPPGGQSATATSNSASHPQPRDNAASPSPSQQNAARGRGPVQNEMGVMARDEEIPFDFVREVGGNEPRSLVRAHLTLSGFDAQLYREAPAAARQQLCKAIETQLARACGLGDNHCHVQAVVPESSLQTTFDVALSLPKGGKTAAQVGSELVRLVGAGALGVEIVKRSYLEDLQGNPYAIRAKDVTVAEVRSTAPTPGEAMAREAAISASALRNPAPPGDVAAQSWAPDGAPSGFGPTSTPSSFATHHAHASLAPEWQSAPAGDADNGTASRVGQRLHETSATARAMQPHFDEQPMAEAPQPDPFPFARASTKPTAATSRADPVTPPRHTQQQHQSTGAMSPSSAARSLQHVYDAIGDFASPEALRRDAELSARHQPADGPFIRRHAPAALPRAENPLNRVAEGASPSSLQLANPHSSAIAQQPLPASTINRSAADAVYMQAASRPKRWDGAVAVSPIHQQSAADSSASNPIAASYPAAGRGVEAESAGEDTQNIVSRMSSAAYAMRQQRLRESATQGGSTPRW